MKAFQTTVKEKYYIFEHINAKLEVKFFSQFRSQSKLPFILRGIHRRLNSKINNDLVLFKFKQVNVGNKIKTILWIHCYSFGRILVDYQNVSVSSWVTVRCNIFAICSWEHKFVGKGNLGNLRLMSR